MGKNGDYKVAAIVVMGALVAAIELTVMRSIKQDIVNAKKGYSRFENEILKIEQEMNVLKAKMKRKNQSKDTNIYSHYFTLYQPN